MRLATFFAACLLFSLSAVCHAEMMDNPQYQGWAKRQPGSTSTLKGKTVAMGQTMEMEMTQKLVEIKPEEAVIETTTSISMLGNKMPPQTMPQKIPAQIEKDPQNPSGNQPKIEWKEGEEKVEVMGKTLTCKVYEATTQQGNTTIHSKVWSSEEVPGGMVKMRATMEGDVKGETTMELVSYEDK